MRIGSGVDGVSMISAPRGTADILPAEALRWQELERAARAVFDAYGYGEIRTPIFEHTELFERGIGEATDVVDKEMYTFQDRGERSLTLRPEGTAGVVRAFLEHRMDKGALPVKLYYMGPMFRYERPQAGRARQFHQLGAEALGTADPAADAEMIRMPAALLRRLGVAEFEILLNSIGCPRCRPPYVERLRAHLADRLDQLCANCRTRYHRNPLRLLDCKREGCQRATADVPLLLDALCDECAAHFQRVREYVEDGGLAYRLAPRLVRGLDYYTKTVFELVSPALGAQDALGGGGRYDGLVETLGGPPTPGVGFAAGMERILLVMAKHRPAPEPPRPAAMIIHHGAAARRIAVRLSGQLRDAGLRVELDYLDRSLRAQMKQADRLQARRAVIIGEDEAARGVVRVRDMATGDEREIGGDQLLQFLEEKGG
ncbi:MAG TPA: histidine--tRNA ligase [Limnochordales bacterium]|nr:histidine--tRNA ligase [Limnochordales bacterium]